MRMERSQLAVHGRMKMLGGICGILCAFLFVLGIQWGAGAYWSGWTADDFIEAYKQYGTPTAEEIGAYLNDIYRIAEEIREEINLAATADTVEEIKEHAEHVYELIMGVPSGGTGSTLGWEERWYPQSADVPGLDAKARYVRELIQVLVDDPNSSDEVQLHGSFVVQSLNNVVGWMIHGTGRKSGTLQPRLNLTYVWDAPTEFWLSSADTGWVHEVSAQASNIIRVNYGDDVEEARKHAEAMIPLMERVFEGAETDADTLFWPYMMRGGLEVVMQHGKQAGFLSQ